MPPRSLLAILGRYELVNCQKGVFRGRNAPTLLNSCGTFDSNCFHSYYSVVS